MYEGIGRATALVLARRGAKVAINDLDREKAEKLAKEIRSFQGEAEVFCGNVLEEAFPQLLVSSVLQKWGKINCLINNAGMSIFQREGNDEILTFWEAFVTIVQFTKWTMTNSISL